MDPRRWSLWISLIFLGVILLVAFGVHAVLEPGSREGGGEEVLRLEAPRALPDFELVDQHGETVRLDDLSGRVWVADFIFTSCVESCPGMTARMAHLQAALEDDPDLARHVRLVSFSVDPATDRPERLRRYAANHGADPDLWLFLTGPEGAVADLSRHGFLLSAGPGAGASGAPREIHSDRFALVDPRGRIRAYYSPLRTEKHLARLLDDIRSLAREPDAALAP